MSMNIYQTLENALRKEPNYVTDNGELKKWVIINKAQNYDDDLIELLLKELGAAKLDKLSIASAPISMAEAFMDWINHEAVDHV